MEPAGLGVILDSSIMIEAERQRFDVARFLKHLATQIGEVEVALCSITVAELVVHVASPSTARGAAEADPWVEAHSPHVFVVSSAGQEQAWRLAGQLVRVRPMLQRALPDVDADARRPVVVLPVDGERRLRELLPQFWERKGQRPVAAYWSERAATVQDRSPPKSRPVLHRPGSRGGHPREGRRGEAIGSAYRSPTRRRSQIGGRRHDHAPGRFQSHGPAGATPPRRSSHAPATPFPISGLDDVKEGDVVLTPLVASGLKAASLIRLGFLAALPVGSVLGSIGAIDRTRHRRLLKRLAGHLLAEADSSKSSR